jgi:hypothetical protein
MSRLAAYGAAAEDGSLSTLPIHSDPDQAGVSANFDHNAVGWQADRRHF